MSAIFLDSFDDGLTPQKWTAINASTTTSTPRTGTHSLNSGPLNSSSTANTASRSFAVADQHATFIAGFGFLQYAAPVTSGSTFIDFIGGTRHIALRRNNDASITIVRGGTIGEFGTDIATSAPNIILIGNWYHIEVKVVLDDVVGSVEVRVNNTNVVSFSGDTRNAGNAVFDRVQIFSDYLLDNQNAQIDDFYILNGAGAVNNNFIGDSRIHNLLPNGNGFYSELIGQDGNSIDNYLNVDETPPDSGTTYNGGATSGDQDSYPVPDLPVAVTAVRAVAQRAWAASSDAGSRAARNFVRIAGVDYNGVDYNVGATYLHFETLYNVSPATTVAFTLAEFNAAEWGFEVRA